jgi:hypothetical protein
MDKLYSNRGYFETYGGDVFTALAIGTGSFAISSYATYHALLLQVRSNWNEHKCNPLYMPFAGLIMPQPGMDTMDNTLQNFSYCVKQDVSAVFSIAMMPFEFGLYIVIEFIDAVIAAMIAVMEFIKWLRDLIGGLFSEFYNKMLYVIIPLVEIVIHIRDALSKINGIAITSLFLTMTVYNTAVSGVINVMSIITELLIGLISVIVAMIVIAFILLITPAFPVGITMYATATSVMVAILIPTIILYTLMHEFTRATMNQGSPNPPSIPTVKRKKRR